MIQEPAYYGIIPAPVRYDKNLPPSAKLLYSEITALSTARGYCWAGNAYFAELYDVDKDTVSLWISKLRNAGYVRVEIDRQAGNVRRIYVLDMPKAPIENNSDTYPNNSGDLSEKNGIGLLKNSDTYPEKDRHNSKENNKESIKVNEAAAYNARGQKKSLSEGVKPQSPPVAAAPPFSKEKFGDGVLQQQCRDFFRANPEMYPPDMYVEFLHHYTAPVQNGKPEDIGHELWRTMNTWSLAGRLKKWHTIYLKDNDRERTDSTPASAKPGRSASAAAGSATRPTKRLGFIPPGSLSRKSQNRGNDDPTRPGEPIRIDVE